MSKRSRSYTKKIEHKENNWLFPVVIVVIGLIIGLVVVYGDKQGESANNADNTNKADIREILTSYASEVGLDTAEFNKCLDDNKYADIVEDDFQSGVNNGVNSTPSFFVNGMQN